MNITKASCFRVDVRNPGKVLMKKTFSDIEEWEVFHIMKKEKSMVDVQKVEISVVQGHNSITAEKRRICYLCWTIFLMNRSCSILIIVSNSEKCS